GIDPEFRVLDERQADTLQGIAVNEALDRMFAEDPERMRRLMEGFGEPNLAGAIIEVYEALRSSGAGIGTEMWRGQSCLPRPASSGRSLAAKKVETNLDPADKNVCATSDKQFAALIDRARELAQSRPVDWTIKQKDALRAVIGWGERHASLRDEAP